MIVLFSSEWLGLFSPKHVIYAFCAVDTTSWFPCEFLNFSMILMVYNSVVYILTPTDEAWCSRCRRKSVSDRSRNTKCRLYFCDSLLKTFTCGMGIQDRENWSDYVGIWGVCSWWQSDHDRILLMRHDAVTKFYKKLKSCCCKCSSTTRMKRIDRKLMDFQLNIDDEQQISELTSKNLNFLRKTTRKQCPVLIEPPVRVSSTVQICMYVCMYVCTVCIILYIY